MYATATRDLPSSCFAICVTTVQELSKHTFQQRMNARRRARAGAGFRQAHHVHNETFPEALQSQLARGAHYSKGLCRHDAGEMGLGDRRRTPRPPCRLAQRENKIDAPFLF